MPKDIVCGKEVKKSTLYKTVYEDRPYYFHSRKCEMAFVGNPLRYVDISQSAASNAGSPKIMPDGHEEPSRV